MNDELSDSDPGSAPRSSSRRGSRTHSTATSSSSGPPPADPEPEPEPEPPKRAAKGGKGKPSKGAKGKAGKIAKPAKAASKAAPKAKAAKGKAAAAKAATGKAAAGKAAAGKTAAGKAAAGKAASAKAATGKGAAKGAAAKSAAGKGTAKPPTKSKKRAAPDGGAAAPTKVKRKRAVGAAAVAAAAKKRDEAAMAGAASSGDEYSADLLSTYIGQTGACHALGLAACDVLNVEAWNSLTEEEKESLRVLLPEVPKDEADAVAERLLGGEAMYFGSARDRVFDEVVAGITHPRVRRWRQRVGLVERRHHLASMRDYHNRIVRSLSALKTPREAGDDALAHLAMTGGGISKAGDALLSLPERVEAAATAAARSPTNDWDVERWRRVLAFRNQETGRYQVPERAFVFHNPWGRSIVSPLKRGPALDGGRPREHDLLRNERPSHVTILCIVRDAASRLRNNRGTRAEICDLLRDSQYLREGATFQQLNTVVSGALDRLHYEVNAPVRYDNEAKEWCYLHNDMDPEDFDVPEWAIANGLVTADGEAVDKSARGATLAASRMKRKKKKKARRQT